MKTDRSPEQWKRIRALFEKCASLDARARTALLDSETADQPWLRAEVESLLKEEVPTGFLKRPLLAWLEPDPEFAAAGERIGRYELLRRLGRGGMAEVYLARHQGPADFSRLVAVKRVLPDASRNLEMRALFEYEAGLSGKLSHPNIAQVYDFGSEADNYYLVLEFVNGKNLADVLAARGQGDPIPLELALFIVVSVAKGLGYAHSRVDEVTGEKLGIIHRDVSPKNVMLGFSGEVKLVDFGIAKAYDRAVLTRTGDLRGTAAYLSPEAAVGKPLDSRSDLFSLSAILYELLAGKRLFEGDDLLAVIEKLRTGSAVAERIDELDARKDLKAILKRGLAFDREARFASAEGLVSELARLLPDRAWTEAPTGLSSWLIRHFGDELREQQRFLERLRSSPAPRSPSRRPRWRMAAGAVVAAIGCLAGYWLRDGLPLGDRNRRPDSLGVCAEYRWKFCPDKTPQTGLFFCLSEKKNLLSRVCTEWLEKANPVAFACVDDGKRLCPHVLGPAVLGCLAEHRDQLSSRCGHVLFPGE